MTFVVIRTPGTKFWPQGSFGPKFKNLYFSHKTPQYGCLWTPLDLSSHNLTFLSSLGPQGYERAFWRQIQKSALLSQNPTIWVSVDSPGPRQSQFDIFELTWTSRVPKGPLDPKFGPGVQITLKMVAGVQASP